MWKAPSSSPDASLRAPLIPLNTYNVGEKEKQESHWLNPLTYDWRFIADDQIDKYGFVPALEGLRGVVIIPPILSHICDSFPSNEGLGFVGVSSFFVLSGFLVSGVLKRGYESVARASGGQRPSLFTLAFGHLPRFYTDRCVRLVPPLLFCVLSISLFKLYQGADLANVYYNGIRAILSLQNTGIWQQNNTPFGNTWSLAVEEQFYIIWSLLFPILYWANMRLRVILFSIAIPLFFYVRWSSYFYPGSMGGYNWHFSLATNLAKMLLGASMRLLPIPQVLCSTVSGYVGLAGLIWVSCGAYFQWYDGLAWSDTLAAIFTVPTILGSLNGNFILENSLLRTLGRASYAWYIWQDPILFSSGQYRKNYTAFTDTCFALLVALFSTHYIEEPLRNIYRLYRDAQRKPS